MQSHILLKAKKFNLSSRTRPEIIRKIKEAIIMYDHALQINPICALTYNSKGKKFLDIIFRHSFNEIRIIQ